MGGGYSKQQQNTPSSSSDEADQNVQRERAEINRLQERQRKLEGEKQKLEYEAQQLTSQIETYKIIDAQQKEAIRAEKIKSDELEKLVTEYQRVVKKQDTSAVDNLQSELQGTLLQIASLSSEKQRLEAELQSALKKQDLQMGERFQRELQSTLLQVSSLSTDKQSLEADVADLKAKLIQNDQELAAMRQLSLDQTSAIAKATEEKSILKAKLDAALEQQKALEARVHVPGTHKSSEPASPTLFFNHLEITFKEGRCYISVVERLIRSSLQKSEIVARLIAHATNGKCSAADAPPLTSYFIHALVLGSLQRELFAYFESDTFDATSTNIPLSVDAEERKRNRHEMKKQFDAILSIRASDLLTSDPAFALWFNNLRCRLQQAWCGSSTETSAETHDLWTTCFEVAGADSSRYLLNLARFVWGLHKLARAYPLQPEIIRFASGHQVVPMLCDSYYNKDEDEENDQDPPTAEKLMQAVVYTTVFPGFQLDNIPSKCNVVWYWPN
jgi:hypothetical protein